MARKEFDNNFSPGHSKKGRLNGTGARDEKYLVKGARARGRRAAEWRNYSSRESLPRAFKEKSATVNGPFPSDFGIRIFFVSSFLFFLLFFSERLEDCRKRLNSGRKVFFLFCSSRIVCNSRTRDSRASAYVSLKYLSYAEPIKYAT